MTNKEITFTVFGKPLRELSIEERKLYSRAMALKEYYKNFSKQSVTQKNRRLEIKLKIINLLGWKTACVRCGYDRYIGALEFHHKDPSSKLGYVTKHAKFSFQLEEAKKCELLCANCHREIGVSGRPIGTRNTIHPLVEKWLLLAGVPR